MQKFLKPIDSLDNLEKVFKHKNGKDYIALTTQYDNKGNKIITPLYIEDKGQYNHVEIDTNKIKSLYEKDHLDNYLKKNLKNGTLNVVYDSKKRTSITSGQSANDTSSFSTQNIPQNQDNIKPSQSKEGAWQERLDALYKTDGKTTNFQDIKVQKQTVNLGSDGLFANNILQFDN